jgi:hypothetical protein
MNRPIFAERLEQAITSLTGPQQEALLARAPDARGLKAAIAQIAGLPSPNVLSDILAGRVPGTKYRQPLAAAVATDLDWLEGTGETAPDWALSAVGAWCRFADRLEEAAKRARFLTGHDQSTLPIPNAVKERQDAEALARELGQDPRDPAMQDLIAGCFTRAPIELVWRYGERLGIATPTHAEHLARGREHWLACEDELSRRLSQATSRLRRMLPPADLFRLIRAALVDRRQSLLYQGESTQDVEDAMELLWVQQCYLHQRPRGAVPKAFSEETGRKSWSRLRDIQARHSGDDDIEGRYRPKKTP